MSYPLHRIGDLCSVSRQQYRPSTGDALRYIGLEHVEAGTGRILPPARDEESFRGAGFAFDNRHVLYGKLRPYLNKVALPDGDGRCSMELVPLLPKPDVDRAYLAAVLRTPAVVEHISARNTGSRMPRADISLLMDYNVPLPPLDEQRRIVDLLSRAESLNRLAEEAQAKARELIPALFVDMFGDPASNPKGWRTVPLGALGVRFMGGKNLQAGPEIANGLRILKISAVTSGTFNPTEAKPAPAGYNPPADHIVKHGDVLFSRANTAELVGATAEVLHPPPNLLLPDKLWRIDVPDDAPCSTQFLFRTFQQRAVRSELSKLATGTSDSMRNISQGRLRTLEVMCPPRSLQDAFEEKVREATSIALLAERAACAAKATSSALMARLFDA